MIRLCLPSSQSKKKNHAPSHCGNILTVIHRSPGLNKDILALIVAFLTLKSESKPGNYEQKP